MSLLQIESVVAVAEEQHLGRAAKRLCVSQPPLTRRILSLEEELGTKLFMRTSRGMKLLPAGERFLESARRILDEVDGARESVKFDRMSENVHDERPMKNDSPVIAKL